MITGVKHRFLKHFKMNNRKQQSFYYYIINYVFYCFLELKACIEETVRGVLPPPPCKGYV